MNNEIASLEKKVKNTELYNLMKMLVNSFFDSLNKPFVPEYGSWYDRIKFLIEGNSDQVALILLTRPDLNNEKLSKCLVTVDKNLKFLIQNKDFSRKPPHASTSEGFKEELTLFWVKMFEEREHLLLERFYSSEGIERFLERFLITEYLKYEEYLYDDSASDFLIFPLENFIGPQSIIDFGQRLRIRKITQDEFHNLAEIQSMCEGELTSYPEFVISTPNNGDWMRDTTAIITTLRLLKKGTIGLKKAYYAYAFPFRPWEVLESPPETDFYKKESETLYSSSNLELKEVIQLFTNLKTVKNIKYVEVALRRFNLAYQRNTIEDRFIDYFISLESLYSTVGERGEVTHRISTRASRVLSEKFEDRQTKRKMLKKLYGYRSGIVHGEQIRLRQEHLDEIENVVRLSLKWFTNQGDLANHKKIIDEIDLQSESIDKGKA
jgi:hypothetical protein